MQRIESGETSRGSCRRCLSANGSGRVWNLCGDTCSSDEVRWQLDRNFADIGRYCASTCGTSCSREGFGSRGDLFLESTFVRAGHCRWDNVLAQSRMNCSTVL